MIPHKPIISKNLRIRVPEHFHIGEGSIVDDFCYFSTRVSVGSFCHIANNVSIAGGCDRQFSLGNYSSVSAGAKIWCSSDDFNCDMAALAPAGIQIDRNTITGDVTIAELTIIGCNSVVMPKNDIPVGVTIGALSFVPAEFKFEAWSLYAGTPLRFIRKRNKKEVLRQKEAFISQLQAHQNQTNRDSL